MNAEQIAREIENFESRGEKMKNGGDPATRGIMLEQTRALWEIARQLALRNEPAEMLSRQNANQVSTKPVKR